MSTATTEETKDVNLLHREVDRLKSDLQRLRTDLSGLTDDALRAAKTGTAQAKDQLEETARAAMAKGRESVEAVQAQVATHPFISLAVAFAVGMALGIGLSRKD